LQENEQSLSPTNKPGAVAGLVIHLNDLQASEILW